MVPGEFQVLYECNPRVTLLRNFLKLRKEKKLAEERGEMSLAETSVSHEKSGNRRLGPTEVVHSAQSSGDSHAAEQDDWRQVTYSSYFAYLLLSGYLFFSLSRQSLWGFSNDRQLAALPVKKNYGKTKATLLTNDTALKSAVTGAKLGHGNSGPRKTGHGAVPYESISDGD